MDIRETHLNGHTYRTALVPDDLWTKHWSDRAQANLSKHGGGDPAKAPWCTACGRLLNPAKAQTVHIIGGGGEVLHPDDEAEWEAAHGARGDDGDMGAWDLGPECAKMFPAAFRSAYSVEAHLRAR